MAPRPTVLSQAAQEWSSAGVAKAWSSWPPGHLAAELGVRGLVSGETGLVQKRATDGAGTVLVPLRGVMGVPLMLVERAIRLSACEAVGTDIVPLPRSDRRRWPQAWVSGSGAARGRGDVGPEILGEATTGAGSAAERWRWTVALSQTPVPGVGSLGVVGKEE